jgi:hypothetical protein
MVAVFLLARIKHRVAGDIARVVIDIPRERAPTSERSS